jgi:hypothetical protein
MSQVSKDSNTSNTSKKISKIEKFDPSNIITLNQQVIDKRYLILDLWDKINDQVNQVFLQINNLNVLSLETIRNKNDAILFHVADRSDIIESMTKIENHILDILKRYLAKINKKGKFNFCSIINQNVMRFNSNNSDYNMTIFDHDKKRITDLMFLINSNQHFGKSTFNIIFELMNIRLDMISGSISIDSRLRLIIENMKIPERIKLTDADVFIMDENQNYKNHINSKEQKPDILNDLENMIKDVTNASQQNNNNEDEDEDDLIIEDEKDNNREDNTEHNSVKLDNDSDSYDSLKNIANKLSDTSSDTSNDTSNDTSDDDNQKLDNISSDISSDISSESTDMDVKIDEVIELSNDSSSDSSDGENILESLKTVNKLKSKQSINASNYVSSKASNKVFDKPIEKPIEKSVNKKSTKSTIKNVTISKDVPKDKSKSKSKK